MTSEAVENGQCDHAYSYLHTNLVGGQTSPGSWCIRCSAPMPEDMRLRILAERQAPFKDRIGADGMVRL